MLRIATREYFESLERFQTHVPVGKDAELLILKGHLLVERLLEKYLSQNLANPLELQDVGLRFGQKVAIVAALHTQTESSWLWSSLRAFNRVRNELAHQIESSKYNSLLEQFVSQVEASPELPHLEPPKDLTERLHRAIFAVHEAMSLRVNL